jgi:hypothetical protein
VLTPRYHGNHHGAFVPKRRRKAISDKRAVSLSAIFHRLARYKMSDYRGPSDAGSSAYVHRHSPEHPLAPASGFFKGKSPIRHRSPERQGTQLYKRALLGSRYAVSTVGFELEQVRT